MYCSLKCLRLVLQYFTDGVLFRLQRFRLETYSFNGNGVELKAIRVSGQKLGSFMNFSFDYLKTSSTSVLLKVAVNALTYVFKL